MPRKCRGPATTYTFNLFQPFENFYNSLLETPSTDGLFGTGIESLTFNDFFSALQADAAAFVVTFNPFEPGSPVCPGACEAFGSEGPLGITLPIVQDINALTPGGNPIINEWLTAVAGGYANIPTQTDIDYTVVGAGPATEPGHRGVTEAALQQHLPPATWHVGQAKGPPSTGPDHRSAAFLCWFRT